MGIPFLLFMGPSIFMEQAVLFVIPFRYFESISTIQDLLLLTWLIICWVIFKARNYKYTAENPGSKYPGKTFNILDYFIVFLMIITLIGFGLVLKEYYYAVNEVYDKFFILISLFVGYFIIKDIAYHTEVTVLKDFLFTIVIINTIAAGLYFIHQGLHLSLYTINNEYLTETIDGETITRTFWFMPNLLFFSIAYLLIIKQSRSLINTILLLINVLAVYISYTRTSLIIVILLFVIFYLLSAYKSRDFGKFLKNIIMISMLSFTLFLLVSTLLPVSTKYFLSRFEDLKESPADAHSNNLVYRFYKTGLVVNKMDPVKVLFGYGSITETQLPFVKFVNKATADMAWAEVVFRWGYLGLFLFFLLYVVSLFKAFFLFMRTDGIVSNLALLLLLTIFSQTIEGFTQFTIMYPNRFPLALWYFGVLSALLIYNNSKKNSLKNIEDEHNEQLKDAL
jgi:hypothetical protein